jgi:hypothetical protein
MTSPYADRPVRWQEFVQRVRAHRPSDLLPALASISVNAFSGGGVIQAEPRGWNPWGVAAVARESLAYGNEHRTAPVTAHALARILNAYNDLEDPISVGGEHSVPWDIFLRIVYQQWTVSTPQYADLARFAAVFDRDFSPEQYTILSSDALTDLLGLPVTDYLGAAFMFFVGAQQNVGQFDLDWLSQPQFAPVTAVIPADALTHIFRTRFSAPYHQIREASRAQRHPNPALRAHDFNPLVAKPYIGFSDTDFLAPLPRLVSDKATIAAVYYLGLDKWGNAFSTELGYLVETYAGEQLNLIPGATVTPEREYAPGKKSVDWIVVLPDAVVLIEVKSARVNQASRLNLTDYHEDIKADVGKGFSQIATTADLVRNHHPAFADIPERPLRGIVVTAEPHYLINVPPYRQGLPDPTLPTTVLSLGELENMIEFCHDSDPNAVLLTLTNWAEDHPVNVTQIHNDWYGNRTPPKN